jgi:hypothetical protein
LRVRVGFATLDVFNDKESDMKESHRLRIERHLAEFAAWRASGLTLQAFVQQRGEELTVWRARLTWERRWQQMLEGTYQKPTTQKQTTAFVKAIAQHGQAPTQTQTRQNPTPAQDSVCIELNTLQRPDLQARIHWPIHHIAHSSAWLREVLA